MPVGCIAIAALLASSSGAQDTAFPERPATPPLGCVATGQVNLVGRQVGSLTLREDGEEREVSARDVVGCGNEAASPAVVAVLIDRTGFLPGGLHADTQAFKRSVEHLLRRLPTTALVAVYSYGFNGDFVVLRDISYDAGKIRVRLSTPDVVREALAHFDIPPNLRTHSTIELKSGNLWVRMFGVVEGVANHLSSIPGRKALVWLGSASAPVAEQGDSRFEVPWLEAMAALERADMVVYPVPTMVECKECGRWAEFTGGRVLYGEDQVERAIEVARQDSGCYTRITWMRKCPPVSVGAHAIEVTPHSAVHARRYYFEAPVYTGLAARLKAAEAAFETPLDATAVNVSVHLDGAGAAIVEYPLGGVLDVIFAFFDRQGVRIEGGERAEIRSEVTGRIGRYALKLRTPTGATTLRVVARDVASGKIGSATIRLR